MEIRQIKERLKAGVDKARASLKTPSGWMNVAILAIIIYLGTQKEINFEFNLHSPSDKANDEQPIQKEAGEDNQPSAELSANKQGGSSRLAGFASYLFGGNGKNENMVKTTYTPPLALEDTDSEQVQGYVKRFASVAVSEERKFGIPASFILAHALYQSAAGRTDMARKANNHFALPCTGDWSGRTFEGAGRCFRRFDTAWEGYRGHSHFLQAEFPKLKNNNYKGWAKGLQKARHHNDPDFADKVISIVEKYDLQQYDLN